MSTFKIIPDYNLHIMKNNQTLSEININILSEIDKVLDIEKPDIV